MKHIQHIRKKITQILCVLLIMLGFAAFANQTFATAPDGLVLEFRASKDDTPTTTFKEGQKVYINVKTSDKAYWTEPQEFKLKAPASFETRDSIIIKFPAQKTQLDTPIEYIMPFAVGEQGARVDSYVIDVNGHSLTTTPVEITLSDAKDLVKVSFAPVQDSFIEGHPIELKLKMTFQDGRPFLFSDKNKDVQYRAYVDIPYTYETSLNPNKIIPNQITVNYNVDTTIEIETVKTIGTQGDVTYFVNAALNSTDSSTFLGLSNGETAEATLCDDVNNPVAAELSIDKTEYNALLDEVIVTVKLGSINDGAGPITLKLEASEKDIFANSLTGKRLDTALEVMIPVGADTGTTRLRITPETKTRAYTIKLLKDKDITVEEGKQVASLKIIEMTSEDYTKNNYILKLTTDSASKSYDADMIQGQTGYLYITSTFNNFRMGIIEPFTFAWTVEGVAPLPIIGASNNECAIARGDAQTLISITPQSALEEKIFTYNPILSTQGKTKVAVNGVRVTVSARTDRLIALDGVDSIEYGKTFSLRGFLADTAMNPTQTGTEIKFRLHVSPENRVYIENGESRFNAEGFSFETYSIPPQASYSDPIQFTAVSAKNEYTAPINFAVTPVSDSIKINQAKTVVIYDNVNLTLETHTINGVTAEGDHELPESANVGFKLKLSKPTSEKMNVVLKYSPTGFLGKEEVAVIIPEGANEVIFPETVYSETGFQGKRQLQITFDSTKPIIGLNKINPSNFYVIDNGIALVSTISDNVTEGDSVLVKLSIGNLNTSPDSLALVVNLSVTPEEQENNKKQLHRENLQDSYTFYILKGNDSVSGVIPTTKRLLNDERQINWSINFLKNSPSTGTIVIKNDPLYKMDLRFEPIKESVKGVSEGNKVHLRATLTPSNNSNEILEIELKGRNELNDLGYPDFVDSAIVVIQPDSTYVDFELTTFDLKRLFEERKGSVIVSKYISPKTQQGNPIKDYFNSVDSVKTKITAVYASPTFRFHSVEIDGMLEVSADDKFGVPPIKTSINVEEPGRLKTKQIMLRAEQISGTLSKTPIKVRLIKDGETTIKNINYQFTSEELFTFDSFEKNANGQPDTPKAKGDLMPIVTLNLLNDASNDAEHKIMKFALDQGKDNNLEDSSALVTIIIIPREDVNPTIEGIGFSPRQPVYIPLSGSGFFSVFATQKPRTTFFDITASGLKHSADFDLFIVREGAAIPLLNIIGKPNTFTIEIPANTSWLTLKVNPKPGAVKLNKEKKLTLRMSNPLFTTINSRYSSDAITIYSDNPNANPDVLSIPIEKENAQHEYFLNCLQNDRSYKMSETDILIGATISEVTKPLYGEASVFIQGHNNVRYIDKNPGQQLFDKFTYTLSEYGQGKSPSSVNIYKGSLIATAEKGIIPVSPTHFTSAKPKLEGFYFDSIVDPKNSREKKVSVAFESASTDSITYILKGKIKLFSSKAVAGTIKSNQFLSSIIDDPAVQLPRIGLRITSPNTNNPDSVIGVAIVTSPELTPLKEIVQLKRNKFAIKIDGKYLSNKPTFYFEYFKDNNKIKRHKLKTLKVLDREASSPIDVTNLQEKGTFFVEAPYFITSMADTRIDFIALNQCGYSTINNTNIYDIAKAQKASYAPPIVKNEDDFACVLNNKKEMIVGIGSTSSGDDKSISFSLTYTDIYNVEKTIKLPLQSSYIDNDGVKHDLIPARQTSIFYVKIPHLLLSPEMPFVHLSCKNSIGRSTRSNINWLEFINKKYPVLHVPSLNEKIPVSDMFKNNKGNLIIKCTGNYLTKPTFYGRYLDKKGKVKLIKFKVVTSFYDDNMKFFDVEKEQTPVDSVSSFYIELKDLTPFRDARHGDIVVTTTSTALSKDFLTNAEIKLDPNN